MLLEIAGKLRLIANQLACYVANAACGGGICCGGQWYPSGSGGQCCGNVWYTPDQDGECCGDVWYVNNSPCPNGYIYLRWGTYDECCGCVPSLIFDPRVGDNVNIIDIKDDLCCPARSNAPEDLLPFDPDGNYIGCKQRCCDELVCTNEHPATCQQQGHTSLPGFCETLGCPAGCCSEDSAGNVTCDQVDGELLCVSPSVVAGPDCSSGCLGQCCVIDGNGVPQPQGIMTQEDCDAIEGQWQGIAVEACSACTCRPPFDCACCESVVSTAAGITFLQPRRKRLPQILDTFRVTVSGRTESSIYIHGIPIGASCDFEVTFLLCYGSFNIEPVECGTNFKKLDVKVCWQEQHTSSDTLQIQGCETGTIAAGSCRPDGCDGSGDCPPGSGCTTTLLHDDDGAATSAGISVYGSMTIDSSGTGPLVLTGNITIPAEACNLTLLLTGTNTGLNRIDGDILQLGTGKIAIVEKRGVGTWSLGGTNTYRGQLRVINGTLVITSEVDSNYVAGGSPFGLTPTSSVYPAIGGTDSISGGTAALLFADGVSIRRAFNVIAGSQNVVIGGYSGTSSVAASVTNYLYNDVTFQAASGATVTFSCLFIDTGVSPTITIGTAGNTGTVVLDNFLPCPFQATGNTAAVIIAHGTARLIGDDNRIDPATPATIGSATLEIDGVSQSLDSLSFVATGGTVTGGTLRPVAVNADGTGHEIASAVSLAQAATFTVEEDAALAVTGVVSGAFAITKDGDGLLELDAANTYSGGTTIDGGTARAGDVAAFGTGGITVNAGGTLDKNGFMLANTITNNGGTVIP
jgi:autotransporter-associated beta strand protein